MPQLHMYVPEAVASELRKKAKREKLSLSKYLASVVTRDAVADEWPEGYFEKVAGSWQGEFPEIADLPPEIRDSFD